MKVLFEIIEDVEEKKKEGKRKCSKEFVILNFVNFLLFFGDVG